MTTTQRANGVAHQEAEQQGDQVVAGILPAYTLERIKQIQAQIAALTQQRNDVLAVHLAGGGHDPTRLVLTSLDVTTGAYSLTPRPVEAGLSP